MEGWNYVYDDAWLFGVDFDPLRFRFDVDWTFGSKLNYCNKINKVQLFFDIAFISKTNQAVNLKEDHQKWFKLS